MKNERRYCFTVVWFCEIQGGFATKSRFPDSFGCFYGYLLLCVLGQGRCARQEVEGKEVGYSSSYRWQLRRRGKTWDLAGMHS
jgi:hypothetical protein